MSLGPKQLHECERLTQKCKHQHFIVNIWSFLANDVTEFTSILKLMCFVPVLYWYKSRNIVCVNIAFLYLPVKSFC